MVPAPWMPVLRAALQNGDSDSPRSMATHCHSPPLPGSNDTALGIHQKETLEEQFPLRSHYFGREGRRNENTRLEARPLVVLHGPPPPSRVVPAHTASVSVNVARGALRRGRGHYASS